jgi:hypothetical protein
MDEYIDQIERETMQLIERGESFAQAWLNGISAVAEQIAPLMPELPSTPFTALMPKPADVVRSTFAVAGRLLDASRRLAEGSVDAIAPVSSALMPWTNGKASKKSERKSAAAQSKEAA